MRNEIPAQVVAQRLGYHLAFSLCSSCDQGVDWIWKDNDRGSRAGIILGPFISLRLMLGKV